MTQVMYFICNANYLHTYMNQQRKNPSYCFKKYTGPQDFTDNNYVVSRKDLKLCFAKR